MCVGDAHIKYMDGLLTREGTSPSGKAQTAAAAAQNELLANESGKVLRGVFVTNRDMGFRDVLDGTANTIMMGEIATDLGDKDKRTANLSPVAWGDWWNIVSNPKYCEQTKNWVDANRPQFWNSTAPIGGANEGRGFRWADSYCYSTAVFTMLPPNGELCGHGNGGNTQIASTSSRHQGGAHVLMTDGAVKFITDSIEAGNKNATQPIWWQNVGAASPYGLWGALGTRGAKEVISQSF